MADMHVLEGDGSKYTIVMHFPVPSGNNLVGVPWSEALINSGLGGSTILLDGDGTAGTVDTVVEKPAIEAGTILEHVESVELEGSGQTTSGRQAVLRDQYTFASAALTMGLQRVLRYFGHIESEA